MKLVDRFKQIYGALFNLENLQFHFKVALILILLQILSYKSSIVIVAWHNLWNLLHSKLY